ncbi:hypothetical protein ACFQLX_22700 [Streptomyces polyrhachis]|uniref:Endo-alpha-N-acetylgalactosaminidase domain-containing protein n=1 Tax=Streptomyces polyrhachis TaxID=1282885 RepID=A0ABW2GJV2_9ACTN
MTPHTGSPQGSARTPPRPLSPPPLSAQAGQPYVLYPVGTTPQAADPQWGEGAKVADPGFNDEGLDAWTKTGPVFDQTDGKDHRTAVLGAGATAARERRITGLEPGKRYTASVNVEVEPGKERATTLAVKGGGLDAAVSLNRSMAPNQVAGEEQHSTYFQRVKLNFTAPADGSAVLRLAADSAAAVVRADDVRLVANAPTTEDGALVHEDFEDVDQGWGPSPRATRAASPTPAPPPRPAPARTSRSTPRPRWSPARPTR